MKEPEKSIVKKPETVETPVPTVIQQTIKQPVTIQTPVSTPQQKSQSYWDAFRGYMYRIARIFGW